MRFPILRLTRFGLPVSPRSETQTAATLAQAFRLHPRQLREGILLRRITSGPTDPPRAISGIENPSESKLGRETPLNFPNPRDPLENPLASLSVEELREDDDYWEKGQQIEKKFVFERIVDEDGRAHAIGRRKRSKARIWLGKGSGDITVNGSSWVDYFERIDHREQILRPLDLLGMIGKMDVQCEVVGGGGTGQAEAIRLGIARALQKWDPTSRPKLKANGLLTRDSRVVESKKAGRKKARKSFQWVKR